MGIAVLGSCNREENNVNTTVCFKQLWSLVHKAKSYSEVFIGVGSTQDADGGGEENGKHLEKGAFRATPVRFEVGYKNVT